MVHLAVKWHCLYRDRERLYIPLAYICIDFLLGYNRSDCIIHSGTVIGSDGLGFAKENNTWFKIEHLGKVIIHDEVEIGSNSSVDRGSVGDTLISKNVKIDNLVHLAHNVEIGEGTAIAARSAIAGSTKIGKNCTLAGCCSYC